MYKLGEKYPDWEKLTPLPRCTFEQLKKSHGVTEDTLFVNCESNCYKKGEIIRLHKDDGSRYPKFSNKKSDGSNKKSGGEERYIDIYNLALLPQEVTPGSKPIKTAKRVWTTSKKLESNDGIVIEGDTILIDGKEFTKKGLEGLAAELAKKLRKARAALMMINKA